MPKVLVDIGYWSWYYAYGEYKTGEPVEAAWRFLEGSANHSTTIFACDSSWSQRKLSLPWYKRNRLNPPEATKKMRPIAERLIRELKEIYPQRCITIPGLEADDVIALNVEAGDFVYANDKDLLTIQKDFHLWSFDYEPFDCRRFKAPKLPLRRGNSALAFQLLKGDFADNVPSLVYGTPPVTIFESANPLLKAIEYVNDTTKVASNLLALSLPCPIYKTKLSIIEKVLEDHPPYSYADINL